MKNEITIDEQIFQSMMKLIYMFVPKEELSRLEEMIDQRNKKLESYLYQKSIK